MKIRYLAAAGGNAVGNVVQITKGAGDYLVNAGYAEAVEADVDPDTKGEGKTEGKTTDGKPAGNASLEDWVDYALTQGKTPEELEGLKREEVKALLEGQDRVG